MQKIALKRFFKTFDCDLCQQVQFLAKYPLLDSQPERELTFSYAIPRQILLFDSELKQQRRKRSLENKRLGNGDYLLTTASLSYLYC